MKATYRLFLALAVLTIPATVRAVKVPIPIEGASLNISFQLQTQALFNQHGTPDGQNPSFDIFVRRSRVLINGDISQNWSYLVQLDNPNFGKNGVFTGRALVQDAWIGWAPLGISGPNVVYVDAGILLLPISRHLLTSTTNFTTADTHSDAFRGIFSGPGAFRDTGVQVRGWALDRKIGFRGGVYEGVRGTPGPFNPITNPNGGLAPNSWPRFAGFVNVDVIGSEEGAWLYGVNHWGTEPIVSVGGSGVYQTKSVRGPNGLTDAMTWSMDVYADYPVNGPESEATLEATGYRSVNGSGSSFTGWGFFVDIGFRYRFIEPYGSYEYFAADSCPTDGNPPLALCTAPNAAFPARGADSRNWRAGLNFFFNKNLNHLNIEYEASHGQSIYGQNSIVPAVPGSTTSLAAKYSKSLLLHWNVLF